jgi:hypothetical protein
MPTKCQDSDPLLGGGTISRGVLYQGGVLYASRYGKGFGARTDSWDTVDRSFGN